MEFLCHAGRLPYDIMLKLFVFIISIVSAYKYNALSNVERKHKAFLRQLSTSHSSRLRTFDTTLHAGKGFGNPSHIKSQAKVITPTPGTAKNEKFLMMYTCKICNGRNAQMVSKIAYEKGMVVSRCQHCENKHLIADNEGKLDMRAEFGTKVDQYLTSKANEKVQKVQFSRELLQQYWLVEKEKSLYLYPKHLGGIPSDMTLIDVSGVFQFDPTLQQNTTDMNSNIIEHKKIENREDINNNISDSETSNSNNSDKNFDMNNSNSDNIYDIDR